MDVPLGHFYTATYILQYIVGLIFLAIELEARKQQANFVQMSGGCDCYMTAVFQDTLVSGEGSSNASCSCTRDMSRDKYSTRQKTG